MGFNIEYLSDGTVKATLDLKNEDIDTRCPVTNCLNLKEQPKPANRRLQQKRRMKSKKDRNSYQPKRNRTANIHLDDKKKADLSLL